jgi:hypothetical protein
MLVKSAIGFLVAVGLGAAGSIYGTQGTGSAQSSCCAPPSACCDPGSGCCEEVGPCCAAEATVKHTACCDPGAACCLAGLPCCLEATGEGDCCGGTCCTGPCCELEKLTTGLSKALTAGAVEAAAK